MRFVSLLFFFFFSFQMAQASLTCQSALKFTYNFPNELRLKQETLHWIHQTSYRSQLQVLNQVFQKLNDPHIITKIAHAFRQISVEELDELILENSKEDSTWNELWRTVPDKTKDSLVEKDIHRIFQALILNLEGENLTEEEVLYSSILLSLSQLKIHYGSSKKNHGLDLTELSHSDSQIKKLTALVESPVHVKKLNQLITTYKFKIIISASVFDYYFKPSPEGLDLAKTMERFGLDSYKLKPKSKSSVRELAVIFSMLGDFTLQKIQYHALQRVKNVSREEFLNNLEEIFIIGLNDYEVTKILLTYFDYYLFSTPFPIDTDSVRASLIKGAQSLIIPFKTEAQELKQAEAEKTSATEVKPPSTIWSFQEYKRRSSQRPNNKLNPNKRKNQKSSPEVDSSKVEEVDEVSESIENQPTLSEDAEVKANTPYTFYMIRNSDLPLQTIIFNEDVASDLEAQQNIQWANFIRPLLYGLTNERGQNGVKKMGANMNLKDIYEIQPGKSSYRILLRRDGNTWTAIAFVHKDHINRYLHSLL